MRYIHFSPDGTRKLLGVLQGTTIYSLGEVTLESLLAGGADLTSYGNSAIKRGESFAVEAVTHLPPLTHPGKILCAGLNYADHTKESPYEQPAYPTIFARYSSCLTGHQAPIIRPRVSDSLDYEGEMAVILGHGGRYIPKEQAVSCVAGYSIFNDASVREYQFKSPQWMVGKNFDDTGAFGPTFVSADELPPGGVGLSLETRLNGQVVQSANTKDMLHDVAALISIISEAITLEAGDVIVSGTPAGIGWSRDPQLLMRHGDICEVEIEALGVLRNPIVDEA